MDNKYYCVILAGGIGSRFWPYSRRSYPKQFLDFFGTGESLIQMTYRRFAMAFDPEHIIVVTNAKYADLVRQQLPEIPENNILKEPCYRNTAAAIAYATMHIKAEKPDAVVVFAPSDHMVLKEDTFREYVKMALDHADETQAMVTLGIRPTHPETGYGYIQIGGETTKGEVFDSPKVGEFYPVKAFTEKPNKHMCKVLVESGEFFWNSGLFFASVGCMIKAIETHLPETAERLFSHPELYGTPREQQHVDEVFPYAQNISFDYGVMEKTDNVHMLLCDMGWADLGTWSAIYNIVAKDKSQNTPIGKADFIFNDSTQNLVVVDKPGTLVLLQGISDTIVVQQGNVLMICRKGEEHKLKQGLVEAASIDEGYVE
ncbi:mannose-1-phosphate guanylyltransferase [Porphyromonas sp.]|uniref:mannose-1-phosphate guanylyltransferase n=1 Tax=Porphyromonas sp. TaxID=1924944 RepID=UPI0026DC8050|nr:mannose-1-phosphate guanylyltransferase [Porphyromonas sp.]MDO4771853.1 mannose-1-phosphate guanylyltransferase [Porphyromonas sp.]